MKSGTNRLHGTLFEFLRNDKFDAENYFLNFERPSNLPRLKKDALRRNQFGLVLSGPVHIPKVYDGKNKTFWASTGSGSTGSSSPDGHLAGGSVPGDWRCGPYRNPRLPHPRRHPLFDR
jgi:hypothetical protein